MQAKRGFSLIELLVGLVLAMATVIVVLQVFKLAEGMRRSSTSGDDAQTTGAIALTLLQRDLRQAGHGLVNADLLGCEIALPGGWTLNGLAPLTINHTDIPAGDAGTDTLLIIFGSGVGSPEGDLINSAVSSSDYSLATATAFHLSEQVIAAPASRQSPCGLSLAQIIAEPTPPDVLVSAGTAGVAKGRLYNWGLAPSIAAYAVRGSRLTVCDFLTHDCRNADPGHWVEIADGIVSLRAQYGQDNSKDASVDSYDQNTPASACDWYRVIAMRFAIVARSPQYERDIVTSAAPSWAAGNSASITLDGDWQHYRYRVFQTTVPLRNVIWRGALSGC